MAFFEIFIFSSFVGALILFFRSITRPFECLKRLPGPKPHPIFGDLLLFRDIKDIIPLYCTFLKKYGDTFTLWLGPICPNIITADHKLVETLLCSTKNLDKSIHYRFLDKWLGQGLLTSTSERWRKHRKILTPAFHFQILTKFVYMFEGPTAILLKNLEKKVGLKSFDIFVPINLYSLDIMCETSLGTVVNAQDNEDSAYVSAVKEMGRIIMERSFSLLKQINFFYTFTRDYYKEKNALKILHGYSRSIIKKRRCELMVQQKKNPEEILNQDKPTFLDILLLSEVDGEPLSDDIIREEVDTFMFEGHDTTSAAVSFALHSIANHPEVQKAIIDEQYEIFGKIKDPKVHYSDLQNMKYLELVIKESLRLFPAVPIYGRKLVEDVILDGKTYPRGLNCYIFAYGIQRNPKLFPNPEKFIPSRFLEMGSERPFAYVPFSAGQRNCIGQKFAMLETKYVISAILRNFELQPATPNENLLIAAETVLRSKNGIKISIRSREY